MALTLMREAVAEAQAGAGFLPSVDLAAEVDAAQRVINAAFAVQAVRVAQYAGRELEQDGLTTWVASLPAADSAACWAAIDDLAHILVALTARILRSARDRPGLGVPSLRAGYPECHDP